MFEVRFWLLDDEHYVVSMRSADQGACASWADELRKRRRQHFVEVVEVV